MLTGWLTRLEVSIGATAVTACRNRSGAPVAEVTEPIADAGDVSAIVAAFSAALQRIWQTGRLASPRVRVELAAAHASSGVLRLPAVPAKSSDRALIVTQRFCRDYKLDARTTAVAFSVHPLSDGHYAILANAAPRALIDGLAHAAASHGRYCDEISSDLALAFVELPRPAAAPGVLVVSAVDRCTLLFLDAAGAPVSVASLASNASLAERLNDRIDRYAAQCGVERAALVVHMRDAENANALRIPPTLPSGRAA
jgi:hypothetical protein